jgi:hypothetical protein
MLKNIQLSSVIGFFFFGGHKESYSLITPLMTVEEKETNLTHTVPKEE